MMKSKYFKKVVAIIMVVAFGLMAVPHVILAAVQPAYALTGTIGSLETVMEEDVTWTDQTKGEIKIQLTDSVPGAEFSAYKLLDIEKKGDNRLYVSVPANAQAFWQAYTGQSGPITVPMIKEKLATFGSDSEKSSSIVDEFVHFSGEKPTPKDTVTATGNSATITPDSFGFYIIQQTKAPAGGYIASAPVLACLPMQKTVSGVTSWKSSYTVMPKDDKISITKKVQATGDAVGTDETIAEIGDTLTYEIVAKLATYGSDIINAGGIVYTLEDPLPNAITYNDGSAQVKFHKKNDPADTYVTLGGYTVDDSVSGKLTLDLSANYATNLADYDEVKITYTAKFNQSDNIVIEGAGISNTATLEYTSAVGKTQTIKSTAKVFTLELDITKVDKDATSKHLKGATFQVYRTQTAANDEANAIQFIDISASKSDGIKHYRVATAEEIADPSITTTKNITVSDEDDPLKTGKMNIYGLNDQEYHFKETVAPIGYNVPDHLFDITVAPEGADYNAGKLNFDGNHLHKEIENDSGINLPVTGGMGTVLFTAIGLLLMAGAVYFLFGKKKESH